MSDDHTMSSADAAAAAEAAVRIRVAIESRWEAIEGPAGPSFIYRRRQGMDVSVGYVGLAPVPARDGNKVYGFASLATLEAVVLEFFEQAATDGRWFGCHADPERDRVVWRHVPDVALRPTDGRWVAYMRLAFMPKDAWILEEDRPSGLSSLQHVGVGPPFGEATLDGYRLVPADGGKFA